MSSASWTYHPHRCKECGGMRCDKPGETCAECQAHMAAPKQPGPAMTKKPDPDAMLRKLMQQATGNVSVSPPGAGMGQSPAPHQSPPQNQKAPPPPHPGTPLRDEDRYRFLFVHRKYRGGYLPMDIDEWRRNIDQEIANTGWKP